MAYLFLDTETTGLERYDQVTEISYAINSGPITTCAIYHTRVPSEWTLKNTGYMERVAFAPKIDIIDWQLRLFREARDVWPEKLHLVGANPAFDVRLISQSPSQNVDNVQQRLINVRPWHFRLIDIESMAMQQFKLREPPSLKEIGERLGLPPCVDKHTSTADVEYLRTCFMELTK